MKPPFKTVEPTGAHKSFRDDMIKVLAKHGKNLRADEMLALAAYTTGQLIALQDQRTMTPEMAIQLVEFNLQDGNLHALENGVAGARSINELPV